MRACIQHVAWGLATAALMVVTPLPVAATRAPTPRATTRPAPAPAADEQKGSGWRELYCAACVGVGTFVSKSNGGIWGNLLLGGPIGAAIDAGSGAGFDYPASMTVIMNPPCPSK